MVRRVGIITELWRYPISSVGGELIGQAALSAEGFAADRRFALVDAETGMPADPDRSPRWHKTLMLKSRHREGSGVEVGFPDGRWFEALVPGLDDALTAFFEFPVALRPYEGTEVAPGHSGAFAVNRYRPSPIHLVTTASLDRVKELSNAPDADRRRFRPNLLVSLDDDAHGFVESAWVGETLQVGDSILTVSEHARRCGMTIIRQEDIPDNADILRTIVRHNRHNLGVYCTITTAGTIRVGDVISM